VKDRCELVAGDFFEAVPRGDVVLLSWVLHDWDDDRPRKILRACRAAGAETLLIIEALLPRRAAAIGEATPGLLADPFALDMQMLLLTGGKERSLEEYEELLRGEGYEVEGVAPLSSERGASLLTARLRRNYE
jgi:O-methyltransferase